jgi:nucleotide-binding universal stress UspA family protein
MAAVIMANRPRTDAEDKSAASLTGDVLVPVDYSEPSRKALAAGLRLAQTLGSKVVVLHAWDCPPIAAQVRAAPASPGAAHRPLGELIADAAATELDRFVQSAVAADAVRLETRLVSGSPVRAILEELASKNYGFVVMGTHGHTPAGSLLLGSVTERVLRLSATPVLVIPAR